MTPAEKRKKILKFAGAAAVIWVLLVWWLGGALGLAGADLWVMRGVLWVLGLGATGAIAWLLLRQLPKEPGSAVKTRTDDIDAVIAAARTALHGARPAGEGGGRTSGRAAIGSLPMVIVTGPSGSAKTTTVVRSPVGAELLAGDVFRGEATAPTPSVNAWYAQEAVLLEAGGTVALDPSRWGRLVRQVQPSRLGAALGGGGQAPRSAVVCISCEELLRPGGQETVRRDVRVLRERLGELSRALGVRLPVYVVFTKLDRVPHFLDYVATFTKPEASEVLGATLPLDLGDAGTYGERTAKRVAQTFERLCSSLSLRRLELLPREHTVETRASAYEFPRELRKLGGAVSELLVELTMPSQLHASPFLRGYYFTGVQPVFVTDAPSMPQSAHAQRASVAAPAATHVFAPGQLASAMDAVAPTPATRKVPRWDFLDGVLRDVVLADETARRVTQGGARVDGLRRAGLAAAALLGLVIAGGFTVSWAQNRRIERRATALAAGLAAAPRDAAGLPTMESLQRLDSLRSLALQLRQWERDGAPLRTRWGLHQGEAMRTAVLGTYFAALESQLVDPARTTLRGSLAALPEAPSAGDDYGASYDALKAYLITTSNPEKSTAAFLSPALLARHVGTKTFEPARSAIARRQLDFYAEELKTERLGRRDPDAATVQRARTHLRAFSGVERIYQFMLSEAAKGNPAVRFRSGALVSDRVEVAGAFTKGGFQFMEGAFRSADRYLQGEPWVMGDGVTLSPEERARVVETLRDRYRQDYAGAWRSYLNAVVVSRYGGMRDASQKLGQLAGPQSPLLAALALASEHTGVSDSAIAQVFQPVHAVVPPGSTDKLVSEGNAPYMGALAQLQSAIDQAANAPPGSGEAVAQAAAAQASNAKLAVKQMAQGFRLDAVGRVEATVERLLTAPITYVEPMLRGVGAAEVNAAGADFCATVRPLLARFPFTPGASAQAPVADVHAMFRPETGTLWTFTEQVQKVVVRRGDQFVSAPGTSVPANPAFIGFLNRSAAFSDAIYRHGMSFTLRPVLPEGVQSLTVTIDGQTARWQPGSVDARQFSWLGVPNGEARISARIGGQDVAIAAFQGPWAAFQLFHSAASWRTGATNVVEWEAAGRPRISMELVPRGGQPVMRRDYFNGYSCVGRVAR